MNFEPALIDCRCSSSQIKITLDVGILREIRPLNCHNVPPQLVAIGGGEAGWDEVRACIKKEEEEEEVNSGL